MRTELKPITGVLTKKGLGDADAFKADKMRYDKGVPAAYVNVQRHKEIDIGE